MCYEYAQLMLVLVILDAAVCPLCRGKASVLGNAMQKLLSQHYTVGQGLLTHGEREGGRWRMRTVY